MATPEDIESRLRAVEREAARLREQQGLSAADAAAARTLAAGADRDVSEVRAELRAHTRALNALRETQLEQGDRLTGVEGRLTGVEGRLDRLEARLEGLEARMADGFATLGAGMNRIVQLLEQPRD